MRASLKSVCRALIMNEQEQLVMAYRKLWPGRAAAQNATSSDEVRKLAEDELSDRLTHPRLRKDRPSKLAEIEKRIRTSSLSDADQDILIRFYQSLMP